jgi:hypothetical protein
MVPHQRPLPRVKYAPRPFDIKDIAPGSVVYNIMYPTHTPVMKCPKRPIYKADDYFRLLEKNNKQMGIPYVKPDIPDPIIVKKNKLPIEPTLEYIDSVQVILKVLKSGIIRVKINYAIASLYERNKKPGIKSILQAFKSHGFSQYFLDDVKRRYDRRVIFGEKVPTILDKIFNKEPVKKVKKIKIVKPVPEEEPEPEPEPEEEEEEEEEEDAVPIEEGEMDVEVEADEEQPEEDYVSDVEE